MSAAFFRPNERCTSYGSDSANLGSIPKRDIFKCVHFSKTSFKLTIINKSCDVFNGTVGELKRHGQSRFDVASSNVARIKPWRSDGNTSKRQLKFFRQSMPGFVFTDKIVVTWKLKREKIIKIFFKRRINFLHTYQALAVDNLHRCCWSLSIGCKLISSIVALKLMTGLAL